MSTWADHQEWCIHNKREGLDSHDCSMCHDIAYSLGYDQKNGETYIFRDGWKPPEGTSLDERGRLHIDWEKTPWNIWVNIKNTRIPYTKIDDLYIINILVFLRRKLPPVESSENLSWPKAPWSKTPKRWHTNDPKFIALVAEAALRPKVDQEKLKAAIRDDDWIEELRPVAKAAQRLRGRGILNARVALVGHNLAVVMDSPDADRYRKSLEEK